jgi:hypothetical protein
MQSTFRTTLLASAAALLAALGGIGAAQAGGHEPINSLLLSGLRDEPASYDSGETVQTIARAAKAASRMLDEIDDDDDDDEDLDE